MSTPKLVQDLLLSHVVVQEVSAGMYHNAVLSVDGEVMQSEREKNATRKKEKKRNDDLHLVSLNSFFFFFFPLFIIRRFLHGEAMHTAV